MIDYDRVLKKEGSLRKAATSLNLSKTKFTQAWKAQLGLCIRSSACQEKPEPGKSACKKHLELAGKQDPIKKKESFKRWREKNIEKLTEYNKNYQKANLHKFRAYNKKHRELPENKAYNRAKTSLRRANKLQATPKWANKTLIKEIFAKCPKGYHVDHIIPLINDNVCGLHVEHNLQYLPAVINDIKFNKFDGTYNNWSWASEFCHQFVRRLDTLKEDVLSGKPFETQVSDYEFQVETITPEHQKFIKRYEWLGTIGWSVKRCFTARYNGLLTGVVIISNPANYTKFDDSVKLEALIQRGATSSWAPKNLNSKLLMFACNWMVKNTDKRVFIGYSDPTAGEIGTIYQACNFKYLGNKFGAGIQYKIKENRWVSGRFFTRTGAFKKYAKNLGIQWKKEWEEKGFQKLERIPEQVKKELFKSAKEQMQKCETRKIPKKGKYMLVLAQTHSEKKKLLEITKEFKSYPYPKRKP